MTNLDSASSTHPSCRDEILTIRVLDDGTLDDTCTPLVDADSPSRERRRTQWIARLVSVRGSLDRNFVPRARKSGRWFADPVAVEGTAVEFGVRHTNARGAPRGGASWCGVVIEVLRDQEGRLEAIRIRHERGPKSAIRHLARAEREAAKREDLACRVRIIQEMALLDGARISEVEAARVVLARDE
jgi:hypothetical protein